MLRVTCYVLRVACCVLRGACCVVRVACCVLREITSVTQHATRNTFHVSRTGLRVRRPVAPDDSAAFFSDHVRHPWMLVMSPAGKGGEVEQDVDEGDDGPQGHLEIAREIVRIEHGHDVMLDETAFIGDAATALAEPVFQGRQGANLPGPFHVHAPEHGRHVKQGDPPASKDEQPTAQHEQHEAEVEHDDRMGGEKVSH